MNEPFVRLRIQPIPSRMALCRVCGHIEQCDDYDHDLKGEVGFGCAQSVRIAEINLINAGMAIPTTSILEDQP